MTLAAYESAVLADSPEGFWTLQSDATDSSGHGRDGTVSGTLTTASSGPGVDVDALQFGAGWIVVPDNNVWSSTHFTVEAWVRGRESGDVNTFIRKSTGSAADGEWLLSDGNTTTLRFRISNTSRTTWRGTFDGPIDDDPCPLLGWHHVAASFDGSACRAYVDGALVATPGTGPSGTRAGNTTGNLVIGAAHDTGTEAMGGAMAMVAYYSSALSDARIAAHYAAMSLNPPCASLSGWHIGSLRFGSTGPGW